MNAPLPLEVRVGAMLRGQEYGWTLSAFPAAAAERLGFACLGGQLQFRFESSICEAYWLSADASKRLPEESWCQYVHRSCGEVTKKFTDLVENLDVQKVVHEWPALHSLVVAGFNPDAALVFVAYFVTEAEYVQLGCQI